LRCRATQDAIGENVINQTISETKNVSVKAGWLEVSLNYPTTDLVLNKSDAFRINVTATCHDSYCGNVALHFSFNETNYIERPILWLKFDEYKQKQEDNSGYGNIAYLGNDLSVTSNGASFSSGFISNALKFDGVDDYVRVENNAILNPGNITILAWINGTSWSSPNEWHRIVRKEGQYVLSISNTGRIGCWFYIAGGWRGSENLGNTVLNTSQWYFVGCSYNGSHIIAYLNGKIDGYTTYSGSIASSTNPLYVGAYGTSERFNGIIDELMIFNRSLSEEEMNEIYSQFLNGKPGWIKEYTKIKLESGTNPYTCGIMDATDVGNVSCTYEITVRPIKKGAFNITIYTTNDPQIPQNSTSFKIETITGSLNVSLSLDNSALNGNQQANTNEQIFCNDGTCFNVSSYLISRNKRVDNLLTNNSFWYTGNRYIAAIRDNGWIYLIRIFDNGTFSSPVSLYNIGSNSRGISIADFDNDGCLDIVAGNGAGFIYFMKGYCNGTFDSPKYAIFSNPLSLGWAMDFAEGDFNNDGCLDIILGGDNRNIYLLTGNCDGSFNVSLITNSAPGSYGRGKDSGDLNGDGNLDFIYADNPNGNVWVFYGYGNGSFSSPISLFDTLGSSNDPYGLAIGDLDNDGCDDIVANGGGDGNYQFWKSNCNGSFYFTGSIVITSRYGALKVYDFDRDGLNDLVLTTYDAYTVNVYKNLGNYTFILNSTSNLGGNVIGVSVPYELSFVKTDKQIECNTFLNASQSCSYSRKIIARNDIPNESFQLKSTAVSKDEDVKSNSSSALSVSISDVVLPVILNQTAKISILEGSITHAFYSYYKNLILHFTFDDYLPISYDYSGNNNFGAIGASFSSGFISNALKFDGVDDYVRVENNAILNPGNITILAWINGTSWSSPNEWHRIVRKEGQYVLSISNTGRIGCWFYIAGGWRGSENLGNTVLNTSQWYFVGCSYNGSHIIAYLNGKIDGYTTYSGSIASSTNPLYVGAYGTSERFNGIIDELMIFNRSLSEEEMNEIYSQFLNGKPYHNLEFPYPKDSLMLLKVKAFDNSGTENVTFEIKDPNGNLFNVSTNKEAFGFYSSYLTNFQDGNYTWQKVYVKDFSENWNSTSVNLSFTIDAIAPNYTNVGFEHSGYDDVIRALDNITFYSLWQDYSPSYDTRVSYVIFSWNGTCSGIWINETYLVNQSISWVNLTKTLDSCLENKTVGFMFYGFDLVNNSNATPITTFYVNYSSNFTYYLDDADKHYDIDDILSGKTVNISAIYTTASGIFLGNASILLNLTYNNSLILTNGKLEEIPFYINQTYFRFRKLITINNTLNSNSLTDYQVLVNLDTQSLISQGKMRSDCGDIRFTDSDETTLLNYWIESGCNTSSTKIWVKVPSIQANSTKIIYVYYGNPNAMSQSSTTNTFIRVIDGALPVKGSWHFDEGSGTTAYDTSGNGNNGTLINGPTWVDGKFGKALSFDGVNDGIEVNHSDSLNTPTQFTVTAWVYPKNYGDWNKIASKYRGVDAEPWGPWTLGFYSTTAQMEIGLAYAGESTMTHVVAPTPLTMNQWYHVAATFDGNIVKLFINGVQVASLNKSGTIQTSTYPVYIGTWVFKRNYWNGLIDEVRIYNRALTSEEISDLYNYYGYTTTNYPGRVLVRKYTSPEPTTSVGNEETEYSISLNSSIINNLGKYNFTIVASKEGYPTRILTGEFYLENISVSLNLNSTIVNPNDAINVFGKAILLPDNLNVSNNSIATYLDDRFIGLCSDGILRENCWLQEWKYRKPITINNTLNSNNLTDYQVLITLDTASLITAEKMRSDCGDIRVTDSDGTLLNYWIEKCGNRVSNVSVQAFYSSGTSCISDMNNFPSTPNSYGTNDWYTWDNWGCDNCDWYSRIYLNISGKPNNVTIGISSDGGQTLWVNGVTLGSAGASCHVDATVLKAWDITRYINEGNNEIRIWCSEGGGGEYCFFRLFIDGQEIRRNGIYDYSTKIWVKVPFIPASTTKTIYLYYGNPSATSLNDFSLTTSSYIGREFYSTCLSDANFRIVSYDDGNTITIYRSDTWSLVASTTLNKFGNYSYYCNSNYPFFINSTKPISVTYDTIAPSSDSDDDFTSVYADKIWVRIPRHLWICSYDNNNFIRVQNSSLSDVWSGTLNEGECWFSGALTAGFYYINATYPITAQFGLEDNDIYGIVHGRKFPNGTQVYYFYSYGYTIVSSLYPNTIVKMENLQTGAGNWSGTLVNEGDYVRVQQISSFAGNAPDYVRMRVISDKPVIVYTEANSNNYGSEQIPSISGKGAGTYFVFRVGWGTRYIRIIGTEPDTIVTISGCTSASTTLTKGQQVEYSCGDWGLVRITSTKPVLVFERGYNIGEDISIVLPYRIVSPEPTANIGNEEIIATDSFGNYNFTFIAPLELEIML